MTDKIRTTRSKKAKLSRLLDAADMIRVADNVRGFLHKTFDHIYCDGPPIDAREASKMSVMPVCTHRSQADYFIFGISLFDLGFNNIRYAAGDNLTELPFLGTKFRKMGAFPVERAKVMNRTYVRRLCEQAAGMLLGGDNIVVFPEGGRSYGGHMMELKNGMIGACLVAQWRNPDKAYYFFPAAISYEKLPELLYFDMLQKGRKLRGDSNGNVLKRLRGNMYYFGADIIAFSKFMIANKFNVTYGDVYLDYDAPVAVNDLVDLRSAYKPGARDDFSALHGAMQTVGDLMRRRFLALYRLLPMHVVSYIIDKKRPQTRSAIVQQVEGLVESLRTQQRNTKSLDHCSAEYIVDKGLEQLGAYRAVSARNNRIRIRKQSVITYYAAAIAVA